MLIDCPGCGRSYQLSQTDLGGGGRTVMCPRCDTRWYQTAPGHDLAVAAISVRPASRLDESPTGPRRALVSRKASAVCGATLLCSCLAALCFARDGVVRAVPRAAAIYAAAGMPVNVVGLTFARVTPERLASSDVTIRGALRNVAGRKVQVPRVAFEVRDASGTTLVAWSETMPTRTLAAGHEIGFASSPHRLPAEGRTVLVRFE